MASKGDVKAVRVTATGTVFAGRTRLRGIILASDGGGAGTIILQDNTDSAALFQADVPSGDVFSTNIPEKLFSTMFKFMNTFFPVKCFKIFKTSSVLANSFLVVCKNSLLFLLLLRFFHLLIHLWKYK